jgi:hypothetical protein
MIIIIIRIIKTEISTRVEGGAEVSRPGKF